jgi:hypothetical protein
MVCWSGLLLYCVRAFECYLDVCLFEKVSNFMVFIACYAPRFFPLISFSLYEYVTAIQVGRSWVRFPMVSLKFFIDIILPAAIMFLGLTQPLAEMSSRNIRWVQRRPVRRADNLTTFMFRPS